MFDGCLLPLVVPCLLLCGLHAGTAGGAELEVVIPERVPLEKIHLLPPGGDRGGPRRRRALPRPEEEEEEAVLLRLPAAGAELYLHLRRDLRFLARGFAVEQRPGEQRRPPRERLCFYTGRALNRSDSFASLSTCAGLVLTSRPAPLGAGSLPSTGLFRSAG
ncbi:A disintegrin and metalloproteinase with thrombospondin motif 17-like protein [Pitangus sulphuratus]|nr:A disintegrin and metalloproteinase with thrombospondin motif 17-like protein [Pitangus sulphuratus]